MSLFAANTESLFVPRESPLSHVELLVRDAEPFCHRGGNELSRDAEVARKPPKVELEVEGKTEDVSGRPTIGKHETAVYSNVGQQNYVGLEWKSLGSPSEVEQRLKVWALAPHTGYIHR
jgi:hypothetical protein